MNKERKGLLLFLVFALVPLALMVGYTLSIGLAESGGMMGQVQFAVGEEGVPVRPWQAEDGTWHVFLPTAQASEVTFLLPGGMELYLEGQLARQAIPVQAGQARQVTLKKGLWGKEYRLVFHFSENVPAVFVETKSGSMTYIHQSKDNSEEGTIAIQSAEGDLLYSGSLASFGGRGQSTWQGAKKPYNIELAEGADLFGMGQAEKWALLANFFDESLMRNKVAYDFAQGLGLAYSPQSVFCALYVNGEYYGLYQLAEKVEVSPARVDVTDLQLATQALNPALLNGYTQYERQAESGLYAGVQAGQNPQDITGGYLIETTTTNRLEGKGYFSTGLGNFFSFASPKDPTLEQAAYMQGLMNETEAAIAAPDGINPETGRHYTEYIDLESFVLRNLVNEALMTLDANTYSQFMYKDSDAIDPLLYAGPVWDYDLSMGNGDQVRNTHVEWFLINPLSKFKADDTLNSKWSSLLYHQPDFLAATKAALAEKVLPLLDQLINEGIDEYEAYIHVAAENDAIRWGGEERPANMYFTGSPQSGAEHLKNVLQQRRDFLAAYFLGEESFYRVTVRLEHEYWTNNLQELNFYIAEGQAFGPLSQYFSKDGYYSLGWFYEDGTPYDADAPITADVVIVAQWGGSGEGLMLWYKVNNYLLVAYVGLFLAAVSGLGLWALVKTRRRGGRNADGE